MNPNINSSRIKSIFSLALKREDINPHLSGVGDENSLPGASRSANNLSLETADPDFDGLTKLYARKVEQSPAKHFSFSANSPDTSFNNISKISNAHEQSTVVNNSLFPYERAEERERGLYERRELCEHNPSFESTQNKTSDFELLLRQFHKMEDYYKDELRMLNDEVNRYRGLYYKLKYAKP